MKFISLILLILLIISATSAWGFNGERKGFVLGGGLGIAPIIKTTLGSLEDKKSGIGLNLLIGYAWDDQNMIVLEGNGGSFSLNNSKGTVTQGFSGAAWYHYFGPAGKSTYAIVGLGSYVYESKEIFEPDYFGSLFYITRSHNMGLAILIGGGFEIARHWQVGGYISFGKTSDGPIDFNHTNFNILISTVAF